ncbi:CHAT domain-containing protein [Aureibaculum sp. A20]|uniref:CHAT domain-containing protein n=1 Tax=Aureibaculum flavum TaxID=2795986 RepID=A0ABS0WMN8_9FLAO|nr:CHAT domain-containing protein [Aureibaculum flavum]MBJ2173233.1 CHAT domain-containing protein [Aureibaculum flavum]
MKKICYCLLFLNLTNNIYAQRSSDQNIDSLTKKLYKHVFKNEDSTYYYLDKISNVAKQNDDIGKYIQTTMDFNRVAGYHNNYKKLKSNIKLTDSIFVQYKDFLDKRPDKLYYTNSLLYDKGMYNFVLEDYEKARHFFNEIIKKCESLPINELDDNQKSLLAVAYGFTAKMYVNEHKFELAKEFYDKNIRFLITKNSEDKKSLYRVYSLLAEVYKNEKQFALSNTYLKKSLEFNLKNSRNTNALITETSLLVENYLNLNKIDSAYFYLDLMKANIPENHIFLNKYHTSKAEIYKKNKEYDNAVLEYDMSVQLLQKESDGIELEKLALLYDQIGQLHATYNEPQKAVDNFNKGINQLSKKNANKSALLKILKNKAMIVGAYDLENSNEQVISTVDFGIKTLDSLKPSFKSEADKLLLIEDAFPLFESGLAALFNSYKSNSNNELIDKAFYYSEKSKGILLMEALLGAKATNFGAIPDDLIEKEKQLKAQITYLEKEINKSKASSNVLEDRLFATKEEYRSLINTIETNYKAYYNLKYNTEVVSLKEAQNNLTDDEMLVSYFYGDKHIYVISLTRSTKEFFKIENNEALENNTRNIYKMLSDPKSEVSILANETYHLYRLLLKPIIKKEAKEKLIVIADGLLNYIPFGSLNTSSDGINYLIEQKSVSYTNSASLWIELKDNKIYSNSVLAFAPNFENDNNFSDILLPLPHNKEEVNQIMHSFEGNGFINEKASLFNFTSQIANYGIIHLATHAVFDDKNPEYSYLAFTPDNKSSNLLYVSDLYNLSLHANLVTLSACETGIGELKRGEGFMSLTRGFFYSGASSIASTLWKVNDASSTQLMDNFYKNLAKGSSKDKALQKAKIEFLKANKQNALAHPYYWSGFVISGNTNAVVSSYKWVWFLVGSLFLFLILFFVFRNRKRNYFK